MALSAAREVLESWFLHGARGPRDVANKIEQTYPGVVTVVPCHVGRAEDICAAPKVVEETVGLPDVVVNNAQQIHIWAYAGYQ